MENLVNGYGELNYENLQNASEAEIRSAIETLIAYRALAQSGLDRARGAIGALRAGIETIERLYVDNAREQKSAANEAIQQVESELIQSRQMADSQVSLNREKLESIDRSIDFCVDELYEKGFTVPEGVYRA